MKIVSALTLLIFIAGCTTPVHKVIHKVQPGMDKAEVLNLIGSPLRSERQDGRQLWVYKFYKDGKALSQAIYFEENEVVEVEKYAYSHSLRNKLETELEELEPVIQNEDGEFIELAD